MEIRQDGDMTLERPRAEDPYQKLPERPGVLGDKPRRHRRRAASGQLRSRPAATRSPALAWSGRPGGNQELLVTCFDPDAPTPSGFWHWFAVDLPGRRHQLCQAGSRRRRRLPPGGRLPSAQRHRRGVVRRSRAARRRLPAPLLLRGPRGRRGEPRGRRRRQPRRRVLQPGVQDYRPRDHRRHPPGLSRTDGRARRPRRRRTPARSLSMPDDYEGRRRRDARPPPVRAPG